MNSHIYEHRAKDEQIGAIVNCILYQCCFNLPGDGEASRASVWLHKGQQKPGGGEEKEKKHMSKLLNITNKINFSVLWFKNNKAHMFRFRQTMWGTGMSSKPPSRTQAWCHQGCNSMACSKVSAHYEREEGGNVMIQPTKELFCLLHRLVLWFILIACL